MSEKGAVAKSGGLGLLLGGAGIVIAIIAGALLMVRDNAQPSTEELSELVSPQEPVTEAPDPSSVAPSAGGANDAGTADAVADAGAQADTAPEPETQETAEVSSEAEPPQETVEEVAAAEEEVATPAQEPTIDEVRLDNDGLAVIAGRAEPGAQVDVIVDGDVVASTQADGSGSFAALGVIEPSGDARVLSLSTENGGETATVSREEVILAPMPAPETPQTEEVAAAEVAAEVADVAQDVASETAEQEVASLADAANAAADDAAAAPETAAVALVTAETPVQEDASVPQTEAQDTVQNAPAAQAPEVSTQAPAPAVTIETPVAEPEAAPQIALLKSTEEGVALLQTAPEPPSRIVLDIIGYSDSGVVQLSGRASEAASEVRVYLNNRSIATLPVDEAGNWRGDVPDIDTGVYTLRVDAVDTTGDVTSRLETPFKREAPEVLAAATSGASGQVSAVTVQTGDTLWAIARDRYGEGLLYVRVFDANRTSIRNPDLIYPGQVFDLPDD